MINKITHGNCLEIIPKIDDLSLDAIVIDPPFGENQGYEGDDSIQSARKLLSKFLDVSYPKLKRNAHIAIFWTMRNLDVCIDLVKEKGLTYRRTLSMYLPRGGARPYLGWLPRTQGVVIGQRYLPSQPTDFHKDLAMYLSVALGKSEFTRASLSRELGCDSRLVMKWTRVNDPAWCLPTPKFYERLKSLLHLDDKFDILLDREPTSRNMRHDYEFHHDCYVVDNKAEEMIHPSQKPLFVIEHIVSCVCPAGGLVLDGFSGSGTTALAAKNTGRNFICIEADKNYCDMATARIK